MKKIYLDNLTGLVQHLCREITLDNWKPETIVGIGRGGLVPAVMISHYFKAPMVSLDISLSTGEQESNCWLPEDALNGKRLLVVDDINDTGATFAWLKRDWEDSVRGIIPRKGFPWHANVKFATLVDNAASAELVDYSAMTINKEEDPQWIVFPWEDFWQRG